MAKFEFSEKVVVLFGATGGLGEAIARTLIKRGALVMLVGRKPDALQTLATQLGERTAFALADVTDWETLDAVCTTTLRQFGRIDMVINATGYDVRKPLMAHSDDDIARTININLSGAIRLTRVFLPALVDQNHGMIVHLGGFGDGRLAFPFYSVDVASRAGLHGFIESINRELRLLNHDVRVMYFGPTSADTEAERPYHALWNDMGVQVVPPEEIAEALMEAISARKSVAVMGFGARALTLLNAISPCTADALIVNRYGTILKKHLADSFTGVNPPLVK